MRRILFGVLMISIVLFTSCSKKIDYKIVSEIDKLYYTTSFMENIFNAINIDSVSKFYSESNVDNLIMTDNIKNLPQDKEFKKNYVKYGSASKSFKRFIKNAGIISKSIEKSKTQLKNLKYDYTNKLLDEEQIKEFFKDEKIAVDAIIYDVKRNKASLEYNTAIYKSLRVEMRKIADELSKMQVKR